ncbi:MAG: ABC transporter substrate-binding protein [Acetobacteraceae bacterium]
MRRRSFLAGAASASLARPAIAAPSSTLIFVPQAALSSIDPVWTSAMTVRNFGMMVFETLYGRDAEMNAKPQMLAGELVKDDGRRRTMTLREGLRFHDGERVLARDCAASLRRWMKRDPVGATIEARLDALETPDDRTIVWRLRKPFAHLPKALSKFQTAAVMMPARIAATDPFKQIPEAIGSGPFRFLPNEQVIGSFASFAKFDGYVPRDEPASFTAGGHRALLDRIEWHMIPDGSTAANALMTGEVDWIEQPVPDLLAIMRRAGVVTERLDDWGFISQLRPNHLIAPTSNVGVRRAIMAAMNQRDVMQAMMGGDPDGYVVPVGFLVTGKPEVDLAGIEAVSQPHSADEVKAMLDRAGYNGERLVLLHSTDQPFHAISSTVVADTLSRAGLNIDDQAMDWGTTLQRRGSKEPLEKGGWSLFTSVTPVPESRDPLLASLIRGNGKDAWFGWPSDPKIEAIYAEWLDAPDPAEQTRLERDYQLAAFDSVPFIPLGRYMLRAAWSPKLSGPLKGPAPVFWNVSKG